MKIIEAIAIYYTINTFWKTYFLEPPPPPLYSFLLIFDCFNVFIFHYSFFIGFNSMHFYFKM